MAIYDSAQTDGLRNADLVSMFTFSMANTLTVKTGASRLYAEYAFTIVAVRASVGTPPTGSSIIVDVLRDGNTIYTTQSNRPTILAGSNTVTANSPDITSFNSGDYLTVNISQVGSIAAGADLTVTVTLRRA